MRQGDRCHDHKSLITIYYAKICLRIIKCKIIFAYSMIKTFVKKEFIEYKFKEIFRYDWSSDQSRTYIIRINLHVRVSMAQTQ